MAENVWLGREPRRRGAVDVGPDAARHRRAARGARGQRHPAGQRVRSLSVAEQQIVEIAKAVSFDARVIQMDEPTAALADHEVELLYAIIRGLTARGVAILYVSHRLKEVFDLCDTITVLKDGRQVATQAAGDLDDATLVRLMVGRAMSAFFPDRLDGTEIGERRRSSCAAPATATSTASTSRCAPARSSASPGCRAPAAPSCSRRCSGSARSPAARWSSTAAPTARRSPRQAVRAGLAMVTEDRKATGLALNQTILDNALGVVRAVFPRRTPEARREMPGLLSSMAVSARAMDQEAQFLSGGNQQKVVLARWLATQPRVVLMDEPTRGIDVGAKQAHLRADAHARGRRRQRPDGVERAARGDRHVRPDPGDARRPARRRAARGCDRGAGAGPGDGRRHRDRGGAA